MVEGSGAEECFSASGGGGKEISFGGGVISAGGSVRAACVGDQLEVAAPVEVGIGLGKEVFGCGDDVGMRGCPGESGGRRFMTGCGGVSLFGEFDGAAGAAHRIATAPRRAVRVRPHLAASGAVIETLRTRGVRNMIAVLPVVSRAYELWIPLPHTESQTPRTC